MKDEEDPLLRELRGLPTRGIDDVTGERVRRQAQAVLDGERRLARRPWLRPAARAWGRVGAPALLASAVAVYLWWAFSFTAALYG